LPVTIMTSACMRPPVATERLSLTEGGQVRCALKTPYRTGPRTASPDRARVVPKTRAAAAKRPDQRGEASASARQRALTWSQRLKRVFAIDIEVCRRCGGKLPVIVSIEEPAVIDRILEHLGCDSESVDPANRAGHRPRPISCSDCFVIPGTTRATVRDGRVLA
jgi:hypothetical protein